MFFVIFVVIPINGTFMIKGQVMLGVVLMLMQVPYFYGIAKEIEGKDCATIFNL